MSSTPRQTIPQDWDDARDVPFFRVTARLFSAAVCSGASVLLASNDDDREAAVLAVELRTVQAPSVTVDAVRVPHRS